MPDTPALLVLSLPVVPPNWLATWPTPAATLLCVLAVLATPLAAGVPVVWLLRGRRALTAGDWLLAPFVGLGALVLVLQNLVYLDVPVARSAPFVWLALAALLAVFFTSGHARASLRALPRGAVAVALLAYGVQGFALLQIGPRHWVGRLWEDQFTYTTMAQFLLDEPFRTDVEDVGQRAYLFRTLRPTLGRFYGLPGLKENRIGQSLLTAFHARSVGGDAKSLFGPTVVLCGPLMALAGALLALRLGLGGRARLAAAALAGVLPAITLLQLESFLSHALVIAFFGVWLAALDELTSAPGPGTFGAAALVLSFIISAYVELWLPMLALAAVTLCVDAWQRRRPVVGAVLFAALAVGPCLLNPHFVPMMWLTPALGTAGGMHPAIYPWAYSLEGLGRLWLGDPERLGAALRGLSRVVGLAATLAAYGGLVGLLVRPRVFHSADADGAPSSALRVGLLCLALGPLPLLLSGRHAYQFYKILQSATPALVVGCVAAVFAVTRVGRAAAAVAQAALGVWIAGATASSLAMVHQTAGPISVPRSNAALLLLPDTRALLDRLETLRGESLVLGRGFVPALSGWCAWSARHNDVWLADPFLSRDRLEWSRAAAALIDLEGAPARSLVLTRAGDRSFERPPGARTLWSNEGYELWRPAPGPWAALFDVTSPGRQEPLPAVHVPHLGAPFELGRHDLRLRVLAGQAGQAEIELALEPRAGVVEARLLAPGCTPDAATLPAHASTLTLTCPARAGFNDIFLRAEAAAAPDPARAADLRANRVSYTSG